MTAEQIARIATEALAPTVDLNLDQLSALLLVLAISVVLLAMGLGYQIARMERRIRALEGDTPSRRATRSLPVRKEVN